VYYIPHIVKRALALCLPRRPALPQEQEVFLFSIKRLIEKLKDLGLEEKDFPALELIVRVVNINDGRNKEIAVAREEALEDGLEKGREEGLEKANLKIARNLLSEGSTPEFVQKITGLDLETIAGLGN